MRSWEISWNSQIWHFQFSIWLKYSFGEVHFAENSTWIGPVVSRLWAEGGFSKHQKTIEIFWLYLTINAADNFRLIPLDHNTYIPSAALVPIYCWVNHNSNMFYLDMYILYKKIVLIVDTGKMWISRSNVCVVNILLIFGLEDFKVDYQNRKCIWIGLKCVDEIGFKVLEEWPWRGTSNRWTQVVKWYSDLCGG